MKKIFASLSVTALLMSASFAFAASQLALNTLGELVITDAAGTAVKTLAQGDVGELVNVDGQSFKISYGKDLQGNATAILYPDPADKKAVTVSYLGKNIELSKDAVLKLVMDSNGALLHSGVLGQVAVEGQAMAPSSAVRIGNSGTVMAATVPTPTATNVPAAQTTTESASSSTASAPVGKGSAGKAGAAAGQVVSIPTARSDGRVEITYLAGQVYISQNGGTEVPMTNDSVIQPGTIIRTGDNGAVSFGLFPDTSTTVHKNSKLEIRELAYNPVGPDRHFIGFLQVGKVSNWLDTKDNGKTNYQVHTPHQQFHAVGTRFVVTVDPEADESVTEVHEGIVGDTEGRKIFAGIVAGYTAGGEPHSYKPMPDGWRRDLEGRDGGQRERTRTGNVATTESSATDTTTTAEQGSGNGHVSANPIDYGNTTGNSNSYATNNHLADHMKRQNLVDRSQGPFQPRLNPNPITPTTP